METDGFAGDRRFDASNVQQSRHADGGPRVQLLQAVMHEDAVDAVQPHHVSHRRHGDAVEQPAQVECRGLSLLLQPLPCRHEQEKGHAGAAQ